MTEERWRLRHPAAGVHPAVDLAFGGDDTGFLLTQEPEVTSAEITTDDALTPRADGVLMGEDTYGGTTLGVDLTVNGRSLAEGQQLLGQLRAAWRADGIRRTPGAVAELVAPSGRRAFGRPRRITADPRFRRAGRFDVTADFSTVDDLWYGVENEYEIGIAPATGGGLRAPLRAPLRTTSSANRSRVITVGGDVPTWAVIDIEGDIVNPEVEVVGVLREQFLLTLRYDESLTFDSRPWSRAITREGSSVSGLRTRQSTPLSAALLPPGRYEFVLRGDSTSGTALARIRWANAHTTY